MIQAAWLAGMAWKATFLLAALFAASLLLWRASAAVRHFLWTAGFALLLLLPAASLVGPRWVVQTPAAAPATSAAAPETVMVVSARARRPPVFPWLWLWGAGCALAAVRSGIGAARTRSILRRAAAAEFARELTEQLAGALRIRRKVQVLESAEAPVPLACGILHPAVVLPAGAGEWSEARLRTVLHHELAHIARCDLAAQALGQAACCLYWFHPLAWAAARRMRQERERACDDAVLASGIAAHDYAAELVELARGVAARGRGWADAPAMAESSDLELRVRALFDARRSRCPLRFATAAAIAAAALAVLLPTASLQLRAQAGGGALAGIVQDISGARVPNCKVIAKNQDGQNQEATTANAAGEYRFAAIPAGNYVLEFMARGFAVKKLETAVASGQAARLDASLDLGSVSETITVRGQKPATVMPKAAGAPQRVRVGGNVQPLRLLQQTRPQYPADLQQLGVEGTVVIRAVVSKDGAVLSPRVVNTVDPRLAQLALDACRQWRYQPTLLNGEPVETVTTVNIEFTLN